MTDNELPDSIAQQKLRQEQLENTDLFDQLVDHVGDNQYIPWEVVTLPSRGVYYGGKMPGGKIEVKPMGVDVDKMLVNQRLIKSGQLVNKIVEACARLPDGFEIREMLAGDFNYLLYYLRGITHGPIYEFVSACPVCGNKNIYEFDLTELAYTMKGPHPDWPEEPMTVTLPELSKTFDKTVQAMVRLVRVDDVMKMSRPGDDEAFDPVRRGRARIKNKNKNEQPAKIKNIADNDSIYEDNMKLQIIGFVIDGQKFTDSRRMKIINKLHQKDAAVIRQFIDDISPSVDTSLEVTCQDDECKAEVTITLPWSDNFFRPAGGN